MDLLIPAPPSPEERPTRVRHSATLHVVAWKMAVPDEMTFDPRSHYVEAFWLPVLGPTTTWLLRRLSDDLDANPEGFELDLEATAPRLGLRGGRVYPLQRAVDRCVRFGTARRVDPGTLAVRRRVPTLPARLLLTLPLALQAAHRADGAGEPGAPESVRLRRRARLMALDLRELGVEDAVIERHLLRRGVHPATAFDAARWAWGPEDALDRPWSAPAR